MDEAFYIGSHAASEFGAELLASYTVSGSSITQNYVVSHTGSRIIPCSTQYGLRTISLPVDIYGNSPEDAAAKRSALTAVLLDGPVELYLPDGGIYTALLEDSGKAIVWDDMGCLLNCTYTLAGYRHGPLQTVLAEYRSGDQILFFADGNAAQMECRLVVTAELWTADLPDKPAAQSTEAADDKTFSIKIAYPNGGSCTVDGLQDGDTVIVDGLEKQVLINGTNAFRQVTAISGWPVVKPGENTIPVGAGAIRNIDFRCTVEYYPIFV